MADTNERINYQFTVDSTGAIRNLKSFDDALLSIGTAVEGTIAPLGTFSNLIKQVASATGLKETDKAIQNLYKSINKTLDPSRQLLHVYNDLRKENEQFNSALTTLQSVTGKAFSNETIARFTEYLKKSENPAQTLRDIIAEVKSNTYGTITAAEQYDRTLKKQAESARGVARESAKVYTDAIKHQNDLNAGKRGKVGVAGATKSAKESANAFKQVQKEAKKTERAVVPLRNRIQQLASSFSMLARKTSITSKLLKGGLGVALGKALAEGTKQAINYTETLNLFTVAMKDSIDAGKQFIANVQEWYGLDPKNLMQYTGMFYEMAYAVGAPADASRKLSTSLTALSVDLASLFNVEVEQTTENLISGMRGMSRAVVKYGLDLRATTVEAYANSKGITAQYETMNEASREILRYLVAIEQARDATGDFGETIESPANQLRVFKEQIAQLGRAVGTFLVQPLRLALPVINGVTMALRIMLETLAAILGFKLDKGAVGKASEDADNVANSVGGIGDAADKTKKKVNQMLAPFDELNILQENAGKQDAGGGAGALDWGAVDPKLLALLDESEYKLEKVRMKALDTRDAILEFFGVYPRGNSWVFFPQVFENNLMKRFPEWQRTIQAIFDFHPEVFLSNVKQMFSTMLSIVGNATKVVAKDFARIVGLDTDESLAQWINDLNGNLQSMNQWLLDNFDTLVMLLARFMEFSIVLHIVSGLTTALTPLAGVFGTIGTVIGTLVTPMSTLVGLFSTLGGLATSGLFDFFMNSSESLATFGSVLGSGNAHLSAFLGSLGKLVYIVSGPLTAVIGAVTAACSAMFIGGFIEWAASSDEFQAHLESWKESLGTIFTGLWDIIKAVFNWIKNGIHWCAENFDWLYNSIAGVVTSILEVLSGVVDFIAGFFTGDMDRALKGVKKIWYGFADAIYFIIGAVVNGIISAFNGMCQLVVDAVFALVNKVLSWIPDVVKDILHIPDHIDAPEVEPIKHIELSPPTHEFARGGVVTGPTRALIGEAGRSEAVIPLDNSPQMLELIDKIADKVNQGGETVVKVFIGDREWDAFTYRSAQRGANLVGAQPIKEGRA